MKPFAQWDFTLSKYELLCLSLIDSGYRPVTFYDYLSRRGDFRKDRVVILRHDVDRRPHWAREMARLEARLGIRATYYFRMRRRTFVAPILQEISQLGHEIGYHYENLSDIHGDMDRAFEDFRRKLERFRKIVPVRTICSHGRPLSRWDNRTLWDRYDFASLGIAGEPYLSLDFNRIAYFSDTGRRWNSSRFNIRDVPAPSVYLKDASTSALVRLFEQKAFSEAMILCHPERWAMSPAGYLLSLVLDMASNWGKLLLAERPPRIHRKP